MPSLFDHPGDPLAADPVAAREVQINPWLSGTMALADLLGHQIGGLYGMGRQTLDAYRSGDVQTAGRNLGLLALGATGSLPGAAMRTVTESAPSLLRETAAPEAATASEGAAPSLFGEASKKLAYRPAPSGGIDWGMMHPEAVKAAPDVLQNLPIRVAEGDQTFGFKHAPEKRIKEIKDLGFDSQDDFIQYVARNHNMVVQQDNGRIGLIVTPGRGLTAKGKPPNHYMAVELRPEGDHYGLTTLMPQVEKRYLTSGEKKVLWRQGAYPAG
jgi:hypothetical protein